MWIKLKTCGTCAFWTYQPDIQFDGITKSRFGLCKINNKKQVFHESDECEWDESRPMRQR